MSLPIDKLKKAVDQLLVIQRENSEVNIPEFEKYRLAIVTLKILENQEITDNEWENIKPYNPEDSKAADKRISELRDEKEKNQVKETRIHNQFFFNEIEKLKKSNEKIKQQIRIGIADRLPAGGGGEICKKCGKKFTSGDYTEHIKKCKGRK
jgi:hypothetical protein